LQVQAEGAITIPLVSNPGRNRRNGDVDSSGRTRAQLGDVAVVDFKGHLASEGEATAEPEEIPGAQATDFQVELQPGRFIEGFIDGIVDELGKQKKFQPSFQKNIRKKRSSKRLFHSYLKEIKERAARTG